MAARQRCNNGADAYTPCQGIRTSDHLPVVARIKPQFLMQVLPRFEEVGIRARAQGRGCAQYVNSTYHSRNQISIATS